MGISFQDSKNQLSTVALMNEDSIAQETFAYDTTETKYKYYPNSYMGNKLSYVDENKNIIVNEQQQSVTQEINSQCIIFYLNRYCDGVDLKDMMFNIHFVNAKEKEGVSVPVNFGYNDTKICFSWLLDDSVTYFEGDIIFEIVASGVNEKNENYIWRTKPNGKINILKALAGDSSVQPIQTWYTSFITKVNTKTAEAAQYAQKAKESAESISVDNYYMKAEVDSKFKALIEKLQALGIEVKG